MAPPAKNFKRKIEDFVCEKCGELVKGNGYTDHCPKCLTSKHVDNVPGDRESRCGGLMNPVRTIYQSGEFTIEYRCSVCKETKRVTAAADDNRELLMKLLAKPRKTRSSR